MKATAYLQYLIFILFCTILNNTARAGDILTSWKDFESELMSSTNDGPPVWSACDSSRTFNMLLTNHDENAFVEMTTQDDSFFVKLAGYYGLSKLNKQKALECGLRIALSAEPTNITVTILYHELSAFHSTTGYNQILSEVFRAEPVGKNARIVIKMLPFDLLYDWFQSEDRGWASPSYEALVLNRLLIDMKRSGSPPTDKMLRTLITYGAIPGLPRITYLNFSDENGAEYQTYMKCALEDPSLVGLVLSDLALYKSAYIEKNIKLEQLSISERRLNTIRDALSSARYFHPKNGN